MMDKKEEARQSMTFIDDARIEALLAQGRKASPAEAMGIIEKARQAKGLTPGETAVLLESADASVLDALFHTAREVKERIYGKRIVFFAALYQQLLRQWLRLLRLS